MTRKPLSSDVTIPLILSLTLLAACSSRDTSQTRAPIVAPPPPQAPAPSAQPSARFAPPQLPEPFSPALPSAIPVPAPTQEPSPNNSNSATAARPLASLLSSSERAIQGIIGTLEAHRQWSRPNFLPGFDNRDRAYWGDEMPARPEDQHSVGSACRSLARLVGVSQGLARFTHILQAAPPADSPVTKSLRFSSGIQAWFSSYCGSRSPQFGSQSYYVQQYFVFFGLQEEGYRSRTSQFGLLTQAFSGSGIAVPSNAIALGIAAEAAAEQAYLAARDRYDSDSRDYAYENEKLLGARDVKAILRAASRSR